MRSNLGLFGRPRHDPPQRPRSTINGGPQPHPEWTGGLQRRSRLFFECLRRLHGHPAATPEASGTPIGDGLGMEELVSILAPIFDREHSLIRWVALRGALTTLYITTVDPESRAVPFSPVVERVMGVGEVSHPNASEPVFDVAPDWVPRLSNQQREAAIGVFVAVARRLFDYDRFSQLSTDDVNADPRCHLSDPVALDLIAWTSVALLRLGMAKSYLDTPEPDALTRPGWYIEPLFAKSERYWDGSDWTPRCRVPDGRAYRELRLPLR